MSMLLLRNGRVHTPVDPDATALAITDGIISWVGGEHGVPAAGRPDRVVDLQGALVVPGFVDAHVHTTDAGLALTGLDLASATSLRHCLRMLADFAATHRGAVLWAHGWDETRWTEGRPPTRSEVDEAVGPVPAYVSRVDVHSALISSALAVLCGPGLTGLAGHHPERPLTRDAHHVVRAAAKRLVDNAQREAAQRTFLHHAASHGIVEVHECASADEAGRADLSALLAMSGPVRVRGYLAALVADAEHARRDLAASGAHALGGDLSVDGAIGSHTASLHAPYSDDETTCGTRYLSDDQILEHLVACARAGVQPGFHAIGDDGVSAVAQGLRRAAERLGGTVALAAVTPRVEHAEMADAEAVAALAATGTVASVQPLFDALWGGADGMYVQRLGERAVPMNPFAALASAGVALALGSDAPVTPADPWRAVQAAVHHQTPGSGLSPRAALTAHTRGGHRAAGDVDRGTGTITVGAPAHLALVDAGPLIRVATDAGVARWSTDPRSRVPMLPDLSPGAPLPTPLATVVSGRVVFDRAGLFGDPGSAVGTAAEPAVATPEGPAAGHTGGERGRH